jgi:hypothetical protein
MASSPGRGALLLALLSSLLISFDALAAPAAGGALDPREVQARAKFAAGQYQAALDTYAALFGETGDPIHLRNVARCYQKLGQPEPAIDRFREYLRKVPAMSPTEKTEIEGYIREMEALREEQARARAASSSTTTTPPPASPPATSPGVSLAAPPVETAAPPPYAPASTASSEMDTAPPASTPVYKRAWFWAAVGAVVAGGVVAVVLATRPREQSCPGTFTCQ